MLGGLSVDILWEHTLMVNHIATSSRNRKVNFTILNFSILVHFISFRSLGFITLFPLWLVRIFSRIDIKIILIAWEIGFFLIASRIIFAARFEIAIKITFLSLFKNYSSTSCNLCSICNFSAILIFFKTTLNFRKALSLHLHQSGTSFLFLFIHDFLLLNNKTYRE